ncbi:hypothetical protein ACFXJ8_40475 [Nonomuraea sp. NPDC059194]
MNREGPHAFGSTGGTGQVGDFAELPKSLGGQLITLSEPSALG